MNIFIPSIFQNHHSSNIEKYMKNKQNSRLSISKRTNGIGYSKTGYIFNSSMNISYLPSLTSTPSLAVFLKKEYSNDYTGYMITNLELDIIAISSEILSLFNFNSNVVSNIKNYNNLKKEDRVNLRGLVQELIANKDDLSTLLLKYMDINQTQSVNLIKMKKQDEYDYNYDNKNEGKKLLDVEESEDAFEDIFIKADLFIKRASFGQQQLKYYIIKISTKCIEETAKENTEIDIKFNQQNVVHYEKTNSKFIVTNKNFKIKMGKKLNNKYVREFEESPKESKINYLLLAKNVIKDDVPFNKITNIYDIFNVKNFGVDIKVFKWNPSKLAIIRTHVDEPRNATDKINTHKTKADYYDTNNTKINKNEEINEEDFDNEQNQTDNTILSYQMNQTNNITAINKYKYYNDKSQLNKNNS